MLYVMFTEAHHTTTGAPPRDADLAAEAIRLTRLLHRSLPESTEVAGLLALMLLTEARHPARVGPDGHLKPLDELDRTLWDQELIDQGIKLVEQAAPGAKPGLYLLQACIAGLHAEAQIDELETHDAANAYRRAIAVTVNLAEQQHLRHRLRRLSGAHE
ncbi:hypothetical protein GCM10027521_37640 [Amycolatopsis cihanbeyliensis]|nr:DUF6596 domain-containing protein [Amycolatopsis cihanbeyliensis]